MKVSSAVIKLVLRKNKTLADGTHPIMLRVSYNGMKEKSTHCSCLEKEWDAKNMQLREITVRGVKYFAIDTFRSKTRKPVKIRVRMEGVFNLVVIRVMQIFRKGEKYFLPTLEGVNSADTKKVRDKMDTRLQQLRLWLKRGFAAINVIIEQHNSANKDTVPLIDCERANFYTARHSYAQAYLTSPNASPLALASLMGRSPNTLATYLQQLSSESDVTAASDVLL